MHSEQCNKTNRSPARKKRKLLNTEDSVKLQADQRELFKKILSQEFDLEISLRGRLADTIQSRIDWALLLQKALRSETPISENGGANQFEDAALQALNAIELSSNFIMSTEPDPVFVSLLETSNGSRAITPSRTSHPAPRLSSVRSHGLPRLSRTSTEKLLFLRNTTTSPPTIAKMACTDCSRSDFTSMQGLLNHCRLRHQREYGSHDECMQHCAVIVSEVDRDWVVAHGTELSGLSLPSLRRLFQIAVGDDRGVVSAQHHGDQEETYTQPQSSEKEEVVLGNHLSRTLGHHKDTPALAPFLGRTPKRRCINTYPWDEAADITGFDIPEAISKPKWRMPYSHRNVARPELDLIPQSTAINHDESITTLPVTSGAHYQSGDVKSDPTGSRFHIVARVGISDRSVWIPPIRRSKSQEDHTHRWILSVDSPSYSLHVTAFLARMTITCLTDPPPSTLISPIVIIEPPFTACGTTSQPFLALVSLTLVGERNPPVELEHWVELDPFKSANPVLGDEQVLDIELDRNTDLLPIRADCDAKPWDREDVENALPAPVRRAEYFDLPDYAVTLRSLLPRVPVTLKDVKGRLPPPVPYKLVSTPAVFRNLVHGRRKAIEWGRARALRDEYENQVKSTPEKADIVPLTTVDVYRWLEDEGLFIRPAHDKVSRVLSPRLGKGPDCSISSQDEVCPICGLSTQQHNSTVKIEPSLPKLTCNIVSRHLARIPLLDINRPITPPPYPRVIQPGLVTTCRSDDNQLSPSDFSPCELVSVADPDLTRAIRDVIGKLGLSTFMRTFHLDSSAISHSDNRFPAEARNPTGVANSLAVPALISLLIRSLVKLFIQTGLEVANRDNSIARDGHRKGSSRVLTPSQIFEGLCGPARDPSKKAIFQCLAGIGIGLPSNRNSSSGRVAIETGSRTTAFIDEKLVKSEDGV